MKRDFVKRILKNGIAVYLYKNRNLKRTVFSYSVKYGSLGYYDKFKLNEIDYKMPPGMAHFLEHLLIEKSSFGNMLLRMRDKSYEINGLTSQDMTVYYFVGIKDVKESIKEMIYMIDKPVFNEEDVEEIKHAIIEELKQGDDNKYRVAYNLNKRNVFTSFEAVGESLNMIGTVETTKNITYEQVCTCYDAYYNDENKFIVIAGNIDYDETIDYLESIFSEIKPHKNKMLPYKYEIETGVRKEYDEITKDIKTDFMIVTYKFKNSFKEKKILIDLYLFIFKYMKFNSNKEFVVKLIDDNIIVDRINASVEFLNDYILFTFTFNVLDKDILLERFEKELNTDNLLESDFNLIKKNLKVSELSNMDYIYGMVKNFPFQISYSEKLYSLNIIDKCTFEGMKKFVANLEFDVKTITYVKKVD